MTPLAQATHTDLWRRDPAWQVLEFLAWRIFCPIQCFCLHVYMLALQLSLAHLAGFSGC